MPDPTIKKEDYQENEPFDYSHGNQWLKDVEMFRKCGKILYPPTRNMYEFVKNYCIDFVRNHPQYPDFVWKPKIADVCCGGGFGSNVLSQEADFVWGIDVDQESIKFAKEVFTRQKNGVYWSPQVAFEVIDINNEPREIMAFDIVVCIEGIEHFENYQNLLNFLKKLCKKDKKGNSYEPPDSTKIFISSPNRNYPHLGQDKPKNKRHVREWTAGELYEILTKNFKYVTLMNEKGELRDLDMKEAVMFFKVEYPL
jgi:2-polyprenyl-3-methyl-5-hydroxy-6-metoxy-1,4-benzoquinol methylase